MAEFKENVRELFERFDNGEITLNQLVDFLQQELDFVRTHILK
jgi:hypothetical protein